MAKKKKPVAEEEPSLSFEESMEQLELIVRQLEGGNAGLSDSLQSYEEGVKHLKQCYRLLEQAEKRVQLLTGVNAEGEPVTKEFDDLATEMDVGQASPSKSNQSSKSSNNRISTDKDLDSESNDGRDDIDDGPTLF